MAFVPLCTFFWHVFIYHLSYGPLLHPLPANLYGSFVARECLNFECKGIFYLKLLIVFIFVLGFYNSNNVVKVFVRGFTDLPAPQERSEREYIYVNRHRPHLGRSVLLNLANLCNSATTRQTVFAARTWSKSDSQRHLGRKTLSSWHICRIIPTSPGANSALLIIQSRFVDMCTTVRRGYGPICETQTAQVVSIRVRSQTAY